MDVKILRNVNCTLPQTVGKGSEDAQLSYPISVDIFRKTEDQLLTVRAPDAYTYSVSAMGTSGFRLCLGKVHRTVL